MFARLRYSTASEIYLDEETFNGVVARYHIPVSQNYRQASSTKLPSTRHTTTRLSSTRHTSDGAAAGASANAAVADVDVAGDVNAAASTRFQSLRHTTTRRPVK